MTAGKPTENNHISDEFKFREYVYEAMKAVSIDENAKINTGTRRQADLLFEQIRKEEVLGPYKMEDKKTFFQHLYQTAKIADYYDGCIMVARNKNHPEYSKIRLQVIQASINVDFFREVRSFRRAQKMTRIIPTLKLTETMSDDPWEFDPDDRKQFVFLKQRGGNGDDIPFDISDDIPSYTQRCLESINDTNYRCKITYRKWSKWEKDFTSVKLIRPVHYALFSDNFKLHGRIYTGKYGHQSLRKIERGTIRFDNQPTVELDFSGLHPRMLYHRNGMEYNCDPYKLWGDDTTDPMRLMAKIFVNSLINAESPATAIAACNYAMSVWKDGGKKILKRGKDLEDARNLYDAHKATGLTFKDILPIVMKYHNRIASKFGCDMGIHLMRIDSAIAIRIMQVFADQCVPILGCHDSFIVMKKQAPDLKELMMNTYKEFLGYKPLVK